MWRFFRKEKVFFGYIRFRELELRKTFFYIHGLGY